MSLFDGLAIEPEVTVGSAPVQIVVSPPDPAPPEDPDNPYICTLKRSSTGEEILLCSVDPPPAGAIWDARQRKLALFTLAEVPAIRAIAACRGDLEQLLHVRRTFGWSPIHLGAA